jgi:hypothetical protein
VSALPSRNLDRRSCYFFDVRFYPKNNKFQWNLLFYISLMKSSLDKIFYKIMYHHIICMCDFLLNLDNFLSWFAWIITKIVVSTKFSPSFPYTL